MIIKLNISEDEQPQFPHITENSNSLWMTLTGHPHIVTLCSFWPHIVNQPAPKETQLFSFESCLLLTGKLRGTLPSQKQIIGADIEIQSMQTYRE
jgi:hypothetical protein